MRVITVDQWEPWFAWRPVRTVDGQWRWLCRIERQIARRQFLVSIFGYPWDRYAYEKEYRDLKVSGPATETPRKTREEP